MTDDLIRQHVPAEWESGKEGGEWLQALCSTSQERNAKKTSTLKTSFSSSLQRSRQHRIIRGPWTGSAKVTRRSSRITSWDALGERPGEPILSLLSGICGLDSNASEVLSPFSRWFRC